MKVAKRRCNATHYSLYWCISAETLLFLAILGQLIPPAGTVISCSLHE